MAVAGLCSVRTNPGTKKRISFQTVITLRRFQQSDIPRLVELANNSAVSRRLKQSFPHPYTEQDATWWVNQGCKDGIHRVIEHEGLFVGTIGSVIGSGEKCKQYTLGYWLGEPYWGKGIVSEAVDLFINDVFKTTDVERFQAWTRSVSSLVVSL